MASLLESLLDPTSVRSSLRNNAGFVQNRDRAGALVHDGFAVADGYQAARPWIFAGSLITGAASGYGLWKRRSRGPETIAFYSVGLVVSAALAWLTRPQQAPPPALTPSAPEDSAVVTWLDQRVATLRAEDPAFADKVFARAVALPSVRDAWDATPAVVQAVVL